VARRVSALRQQINTSPMHIASTLKVLADFAPPRDKQLWPELDDQFELTIARRRPISAWFTEPHPSMCIQVRNAKLAAH